MSTISFAIDDDLKARLDALARRRGFNQSQLLGEALLEKIEEFEDHQIVGERMSRPYETVSNDRVWKDLDLED